MRLICALKPVYGNGIIKLFPVPDGEGGRMKRIVMLATLAVAAGMQVFSLHGREGMPDHVADHVHYIDSLTDLESCL